MNANGGSPLRWITSDEVAYLAVDDLIGYIDDAIGKVADDAPDVARIAGHWLRDTAVTLKSFTVSAVMDAREFGAGDRAKVDEVGSITPAPWEPAPPQPIEGMLINMLRTQAEEGLGRADAVAVVEAFLRVKDRLGEALSRSRLATTALGLGDVPEALTILARLNAYLDEGGAVDPLGN